MFILLAVFVASVGAQLIDVDKIVGAFLAGLAVNDVVGRSPVEEKIEFVGSTLFIPFFFVGMGLLLDIPGFIKTVTTELPLTIGIVGGLFLSKFMAAAIAKFLYRYSWDQAITMWSLSLPQVAATLAAALAGVSAGLIDESIFNVVIVLMLITAILGPILTTQFARKLSVTEAANNPDVMDYSFRERSAQTEDSAFFVRDNISDPSLNLEQVSPAKKSSFRVIVPVANPKTERNLIEMGALLARQKSGKVISLSIARASVHMDDPDLKQAVKQSRRLLKNALSVTQEFDAVGKSLIRIDDDVVHGITRAAREENANLIIMGWSQRDLRSRIFGTIVDGIFWSAHCPVAVMRLLKEPVNIHQVLVPIKNLDARAILTIEFAQLFAETNKAAITLLHVSGGKTPQTEVEALENKIQEFLAQIKIKVDVVVRIIRNNNTAETILAQAKSHDLVILRSVRLRTAGGLAVSNISDRLIRQLDTSCILFGEPH